jgi:RHS repeat-associated protein
VRQFTERRLEWDHADRLKSFTNQVGTARPTVHAVYLYDMRGARIKKLVWTQGQYRTTTYLGEGFELHRRADVGSPVEESNTIHLLDGPRRSASVRVGAPFADDGARAHPVVYRFGDHLGSVSLAISADGTWINREEYFPYGETSFGSFGRKRFRFTGKEHDEESGFAYHGARYYAAGLARWISPDPTGTTDGLNLYAYVRGNPLRFVDPSGTGAEVNNRDAGRADAGTPDAGSTDAGRRPATDAGSPDAGPVAAADAGSAAGSPGQPSSPKAAPGTSRTFKSTNIVLTKERFAQLQHILDEDGTGNVRWVETNPYTWSESDGKFVRSYQLTGYGVLEMNTSNAHPGNPAHWAALGDIAASGKSLLVLDTEDVQARAGQRDGGYAEIGDATTSSKALEFAALVAAPIAVTLPSRELSSPGDVSSPMQGVSIIYLKELADMRDFAHELFIHYHSLIMGRPWKHPDIYGKIPEIESHLPDGVKDLLKRHEFERSVPKSKHSEKYLKVPLRKRPSVPVAPAR